MNSDIIIPPEKFAWAIDRAGYGVNDFLKKYPKFSNLFDDKNKPTLNQLSDFAKKVHIPFAYLLLPPKPNEALPFPFFRTLKNAASSNIPLVLVDIISSIQRRQDWVKDYLVDNGFDKLDYVGNFSIQTPIDVIVNDMRRTLNLPVNWGSKCATMENALNYLTKSIEDIGVFITFNSVFNNNNHRPIDIDLCRGFVLVDDYAPFMFINAADTKAAQIFTLIHELAHVWIGVSAGFDLNGMTPANNDIELLCDKVAAELLVPTNKFNEVWKQQRDFKLLAKQFKVSPIVIARKALELQKITSDDFRTFYDGYVMEIQAILKKTEGGNFHATQKKRLGLRFMKLVDEATKTNQLLYRDAYRLTGLQGQTYHTTISKNL